MSTGRGPSSNASLGELQELFDHLINTSPLGIFLYAVQGEGQLVLRGSNATASRLLGFDCQGLVGKTIEEAFPPLQDTELPETYRRLAIEGGSCDWEDVAYTDDRVTGAYSVHAFQTSPGRVAVVFHDITEKKRTQQDLARAKAALAAAIEATPAGVIIADAPDVRIRLVNSAAFAIRGGDRSRLEDISVDEHVKNWQTLRLDGTPYAPSKLPLSRAILEAETVENEEVIIVREDGEHRHVIANAAPIHDASGRISGGVVVFLDITDRIKSELAHRRLERQMQQAQKLESLGVLAGGIAHDFNNLLCVMLGGSDLALASLGKGHPAREAIRMIHQTADKATDLCRQMLAYSGKGKFRVEPIDLAGVLDDMRDLLHASISKRADLRFDLPPGLPTVDADATQMRQIVLNLVVNASEALDDSDGVITVRCGSMDCSTAYLRSAYLDEDLPEGRYVFLEVSDTGCGMDETSRARLFDPFFTTKQTGRGLGLAAVLGIVRGHAGTIKVYSEKGKGTAFKILLPLSGKARPVTVSQDAFAGCRGEGTILLVEDEPAVRKVAKMMLERLGFDVLPAPDGTVALETYRERGHEIRLVILDMTMPLMNGQETFLELRRLNPDVRVILTSGYNAQDATSRFAEEDLAGFIQKPFQLQTMRESIFGALRD